MKEYINNFAKGVFKYNLPDLILSDTEIHETVRKGVISESKFLISSNEPVKGLVYSTNELVQVENNSFFGTDNEILFNIKADFCNEYDVITGQFDIVSSAGEAHITYEFNVAPRAVKTQIGDISNLTEFATVAQESPEEAVKVFTSPWFKKVFLKNDIELENLYDVFSNKTDILQSMEEFLVAARKKSAIFIEVYDLNRKYQDITESIEEKVVIHKNTWGHLVVDADTDCDFIKLQNTKITEDDFTGNQYELGYVLDIEKMHAGKNWGRIYIKTFTQNIQVNVEVDNINQDDLCSGSSEREHALARLTFEYLNYRLEKEDVTQWIENSNRILDRIRGIDQKDNYFCLVQAQLYAVQGRTDDGMWLLNNVGDNISPDDVELYCYYLYVSSLYKKSEGYTKMAADRVRHYYENGYDNWRMLWILFYLDYDKYKNSSIKLTRIKDAFNSGCTSPVMYYEAISIMNEQPLLLRVFNRFELQVVEFGCKYGVISKSLAMHICELANNEKITSVKILNMLKKLYELYDEDEILTVLVTHMIRNELVGKEYFEIYSKSVLRGLRITRLYEFYILSIDQSTTRIIPKTVLMYFAYDNHMKWKAKSYLYANVILNKNSSPDVLEAYDEQIEKFGYEQMQLGNINDNLNVIYKYILAKRMWDDDLSDFLSRFLFTYKVTCHDGDVKHCIVKHKELNKTVSYPVVDNIAYIQMYTKDCAIAFSSDDNICRNSTIRYEIERVFNDRKYLNDICENCSDDFYVMLYMFEGCIARNEESEATYALASRLINNSAINSSFKSKLNAWIISYCNTKYNGDDFAERFKLIKKDSLSADSAAELVQACVRYGMYEDAYDLVKNYGYGRIKTLQLFKLARNIIDINESQYDSLLNDICIYVFKDYKYDDYLLEYLAKYSNGTNDYMYKLWRACTEYRLDADETAQRLITQMLFTGEFSQRLNEVFEPYYKKGHNDIVTDAYIAYSCYRYFVKDEEITDLVVMAVEKKIAGKDKVPEIDEIALLKYYALHDASSLSEEELELAQKILNTMCANNKIFSFYKNFNGILEVPYTAIDKTVVEYITDPDKKVVIHYELDGRQEEEIMKCFDGIFTKCFTLFYGDTLKYYISEETVEEELEDASEEDYDVWNSSNVCVVDFDENNVEKIPGRFGDINQMLFYKESHDMATLKRKMHSYSVGNYVSEQLFKPM